MNPYDAQASLEGIRRLQDRTRTEYVRHGFARPYVLVSAVVLFIVLASFDLPSPWNTAAVVLGAGLGAGLLAVQQRKAPVRRKPTRPELLLYTAASAGLIVLYVAFSIAAAIAHLKLGMPAQHTVAAAALALTSIAAASLARPLFESTLRREDRR